MQELIEKIKILKDNLYSNEDSSDKQPGVKGLCYKILELFENEKWKIGKC